MNDGWKGADGSVTLTAPQVDAALVGPLPDFAVGGRYLVSAAGSTINACGYTVDYDAGTASAWAAAFAGDLRAQRRPRPAGWRASSRFPGGATIPHMPDIATRIGTLREKPLHASLKRWYARAGDRTEVQSMAMSSTWSGATCSSRSRPVGSPGCGRRSRRSSHTATRSHRPPDRRRSVAGARRCRRHSYRSPPIATTRQPGRPCHGLGQPPELLAHPRFEIEVLLTREEEYRRPRAGRCWRRRGWTVVERRLVEVVDRVILAGPNDLACLLPGGLPEPFTTADLAQQLGRPLRMAQQMAYCLRRVGLIETVGKRGHAAEYRVVPGGMARPASATVWAMSYVRDPRVDDYIGALPEWQQAICQAVRDLVHAADPEVVETIKRTVQPYFVLDGNVCALLAAKDHVTIFLYDGG